jgi:esterase/lipase
MKKIQNQLKHLNILEFFCKQNKIEIKEIILKLKTGKTSGIYLKSNQNKKTILFLHGFSCDKYFPFIEIFEELLKKGYSIISFDLPGHGNQNNSLFSFEECLIFFKLTIKYIEKSLKIKSKDLILVGQSLGGYLSIFHSDKNSFKGLVTISAPHKIKVKKLAYLESITFFSKNILRNLKYYSFPYLIPSFQIINKKRYPVRAKNNISLKELTKDTESINLLEKIEKIKIPYLQIHGKYDLFVPFSQAIDIKDKYNGEKLEYLYLKSGHLGIMFSKKTVSKIVEFIERLE